MSTGFYNNSVSGGSSEIAGDTMPGNCGSTVASASAAAAAAACNSSRWITEEVFKLIDMVQHDEAIYNPRHKYYFCRPYVENFWREVDLKLEKNPGASLAKWTNLRISFRREYTNYLEEKIPPCWSYFDRMFFLHPYLRKKQNQQTKSLDSQVQDALVHISSLSSRLQRERAISSTTNTSATNANNTIRHQQLENYFEYFDEAEQNNSELDESEDDHQTPFHLQNEIKSECEDETPMPLPIDDIECDIEPTNEEADEVEEIEELQTSNSNRRQQITSQQLNRKQTRSSHIDSYAKRPRSQESNNSNLVQRPSIGISSTNCTNVSFVKPTFTKSSHDVELPTPHHHHNHHYHHHHQQQQHKPEIIANSNNLNISRHQYRTEISPSVNSVTNLTTNTSLTNTSTNIPTNTSELCDCKTDPDAMFLMSLLPDIQKLNGRDRGKIKIAFQNILQDYLYPD